MLAAIHNARTTVDDDLVDLRVANATIVGSDRPGRDPGRAGAGAGAGARLDVDGAVVIPGLVEPHVHLDKAFMIGRLRAARLEHATLSQAIASTARLRPGVTRADLRSRSARLLHSLAANGVCAARVHVEIEPVLGLLGLEAHLELQREWAPVMKLQLVAFPQNGLSSAPGTRELLDEAMRMGCDVVGGCPYADTDEDAHLDDVFALAERWDSPLDLHLDFTDDPDRRSIDRVIELTRARGWAGRVTVGHMTSLASMRYDEAARRADALADAGIHVVALPQTDIFLGGRSGAVERPGSLTPIGLLAERGVNVCLGTNNVQNAFTPLGRAAPLAMAWLAGLATHLSGSRQLLLLLDMVTKNAAQVLGYPSWGTNAGAPAELTILDIGDPAEIVAEDPGVLGAVHAGRLRLSPGPRHQLRILPNALGDGPERP